MATTTRIVIQQAVNVESNNLTAGKYPRFIVNLGTSITGVTVSDLVTVIQETQAAAAAAANSATKAKTSETNAKASETAAKASEDAAKISEDTAKDSEIAAKNSETAAKTAQTAAETAQTNAETAETNAAESARLAKASEDAAKLSEQAAKASEDAAKVSEDNALASANDAEGFATDAANSAAAAKVSETNAGTSEEEAADRVTEATTQADRAKSEADRAEAVVDSKLDAEDIAGFYKSYKTKDEAEADVANRVVDELVQVWNETDSQFGWYKVVETNGVKSLQLDTTENKLISVNNIRPDTNGNVQVTIPGGNPSLWLGEVTLFPYRSSDTIGYSGILLADGRELNRVDYPDLWSAIQSGLIPSVSESDWQAGQNQFYSTGNGTTTFRLPNMLQGQALRSASAGEDDTGEIKEQVPYITTINGLSPNDITGAIELDLSAFQGVLSIEHGGTGGATTLEAKTNLGLSRFRQDISQTAMLTQDTLKRFTIQNTGTWGLYNDTSGSTGWIALGIAQGGTGALTAADARSNFQVDRFVQGTNLTSIKSANSSAALLVYDGGQWGAGLYNAQGAFTGWQPLALAQGGTGVKTQAELWPAIRPTGSTPLSADPVNAYDATTKRWVETLINNLNSTNNDWDVIKGDATAPNNGTYVLGGRVRSVYNIGASNEVVGGFRVGKTMGQTQQADLTLFVSENGATDRLWSFRGDGSLSAYGMINAGFGLAVNGDTSYPKLAFYPKGANSNAIGGLTMLECSIGSFSNSISSLYLARRTAAGSNDGQIIIQFPTTGGTLALQGTSGIEYKKNIEDADNTEALNRILTQRMVNFVYKDDEQERVRFGVIAEEAEVIAPQYIKHNIEPVEDILDDDGNKIGQTTRDRPSVDVNPIVMDLMGAVQALKSEIEELKAQLAAKE